MRSKPNEVLVATPEMPGESSLAIAAAKAGGLGAGSEAVSLMSGDTVVGPLQPILPRTGLPVRGRGRISPREGGNSQPCGRTW